MKAVEIFAVAWIPVAVAIVLAFAVSFDRSEAWLSGRKIHHPPDR